jgi:hypothetical protein
MRDDPVRQADIEQRLSPGHSVGRKPNPSSPVCSVCRFDRTTFLLPGWPLRPKAQVANPAPAANKKPRVDEKRKHGRFGR